MLCELFKYFSSDSVSANGNEISILWRKNILQGKRHRFQAYQGKIMHRAEIKIKGRFRGSFSGRPPRGGAQCKYKSKKEG